MKALLKYLSGPSSRTRLLPLVLIGMVSLTAGCGVNPLNLLKGSGVNTAANVQAGKTNSQTIGTTQVTEQKLVRPQARKIQQTADNNKVRAGSVKTVVVNEIPMWAVAIFVLSVIVWSYFLWMLPSPDQIYKRKK